MATDTSDRNAVPLRPSRRIQIAENGSDVDECVTRAHGCEQLCNNTIGSYRCDCGPGYSLAQNGKSCVDVDECATTSHGCDHLCTNRIGSFTCGCNRGYYLAQNRKSCNDVDECIERTSGCDHSCRNSIGNYTCDCRSGYTLAQNGHSCTDVDECATGTSGCHQLCSNAIGSYRCGCRSGYSSAYSRKLCNDIDECATKTHSCTQLCINNYGSYTCDCGPGYSLSPHGESCNDINECVKNASGCDHLCTNRIGNFTCGCNPGYNLAQNGRSCNALPVFNNTKDGPYNVNVTEGESVTFNCNPFDASEIKIVWLFNANPISVDHPPERFMFSSDKNSLTIRDVCRYCVDRDSRTDETVIHCNASNVHGYTIASGYINVLMKTKVTINGLKELTVDLMEEKEFIFERIATSDPRTPPTVRWYKTELHDALVLTEPPYVNATNGFLIITITCKCSDECVKYLGECKCVGDNGYSQDIQTINLHYVYRISLGFTQGMLYGLCIGITCTLLLVLAVVTVIRIRRRSFW